MLIWPFGKWPLMLWQSLVWVLTFYLDPLWNDGHLFYFIWPIYFFQILFQRQMEKPFNLKMCFSQWTSLFFQLLTRSSTSISALEFSNKALKKYMMTKIFMFSFSSVMYCYSAFWEFFGQLILETGERYYVR